MNVRSQYKKILHVDLENEVAQIKINGDMHEYIGGVALAYKIYEEFFDYDPIVLTTGPMTGYFPFVSKSCVLYRNGFQFIEKYGGGTFGTKLNTYGVDSIIITGTKVATSYKITLSDGTVDVSKISEKDIVDTSSYDLVVSGTQIFSNGYFFFGDMVENPINLSNKIYIKINHSESIDVADSYEYEKCFFNLIGSFKELSVEPRNNPSCMGCPMGCDFSSKGEDDINASLLARSLVACGYASDIYKQIPITFACLSSIGYDYTHEDLESLPQRFTDLKLRIIEKLKDN